MGHPLTLWNYSPDKSTVIVHRAMIACWCLFLKWWDDTVVGPLTHLSLSAFVSVKLTNRLCKFDFRQCKPTVTDLTKKGSWYWKEGLKWHRRTFESSTVAREHLNKRYVIPLNQFEIIAKTPQRSLCFFDNWPAHIIQSSTSSIRKKPNFL